MRYYFSQQKLFLIVTLFLLGLLANMSIFAFSIPAQPTNYVNDYAHLLSSQAEATLNQTLREFEHATSNQLVVVTVPNLNGVPIEDYSIKLAEKWQIGTKAHNNGIILLISNAEHKVRIEVGYGLEGVLPDAIASLIIQNEIRPSFQTQHFDAGVTAGVNAIIQATKNEYHPDSNLGTLLQGHILLIIFIAWLILSIFGRIVGATRSGIYTALGQQGRIHTPFWDNLAMLSTIISIGNGGRGSDGGGFGGGGGGGFGGGGASGGW